MKRIFLIFLFSLCAAVSAFSQGMSDPEVVKYAIEARKSGTSYADIAKQLLQRGATMTQIQRLRSQYGGKDRHQGLRRSDAYHYGQRDGGGEGRT